MLKKYSGIIASLSVIIPLISVIAGIALAITLESFMMFVYFAVPAATVASFVILGVAGAANFLIANFLLTVPA